MKKLHTCELRGASFPSEQLHHFDGLTGKQKTKLIRSRGTDAAGIAYNSGGRLHICKGPGPAHKHRFFVPGDARVVMGHTRMTTQGDEKYPQNNHPFAGKAGRLHFALAHNGVLYNDKSLRKSKKLPKTRIQTDSYVAVQLLEQQGALTPDSLREMAETVEGSFVFTVLDKKDRLYLVKGDNPLTIWHYPQLGLYVYASTQNILHQVVDRTWLAGEPFREVSFSDGDILRWDKHGLTTAGHFMMTYPIYRPWHPCARSYRPDRGYLHTLKNVVSVLSYTPEDIDELLEAGYSADEVEEELYDIAPWR